jgi:hypothetical protein
MSRHPETETPEALRHRARQLRELAQLTRANAEYAEGQTYHDERRRADRMEEEARELERQARMKEDPLGR